ncbi:MAG: chemotaxis protein CheV [Gammaproteobacteria bacterium]|nr:chemotaxis protein CheV [Gammaproteobacteria bacterium]
MPRPRQHGSTDSVLHSNEVAGTRLELLLFHTSDAQVFGINVFKVQEIIPFQRLTQVPGMHPLVRGVAHLRGRNMPVIDLAVAIGKSPYPDLQRTNIVITEFNRSVQGFLVGGVDRIVHTSWDRVLQPPRAVGRNTYITSVTRIDEQTITILDVERVFDEVTKTDTHVSERITVDGRGRGHRVLVVDDSRVARNQIQRALEQIGVECELCVDGREALMRLQELQARGIEVGARFSLVISDIEMPKMDGYQLTTAIRAMPATSDLYVLLHSSISGEFNYDMVKRTGANRFIQKYSADDLAAAVLEHINDPD